MLQEGFAAEDDMGATDDYEREDDDENEFRRARDVAVQEQERMHALNQADAESKAGPSSSSPEAGMYINIFEQSSWRPKLR